jgi:ribosomal protein S18 acetylase RimI-like enzyme
LLLMKGVIGPAAELNRYSAALTMNLRLRPAPIGDQAFLWGLHRATMHSYVDQTWGWDEDDQRRRFLDDFDPATCQIILLRGQPIGVIETQKHEDIVGLASLEIAPEWQGKGIGTRLIRSVIERASPRPVVLQVLRVNPARRLYERLGFVVTAETEVHYVMKRTPSALEGDEPVYGRAAFGC